MSWLVQYRATSGALVNTTHDTRREAFETLADSLLASALVLWELGDRQGAGLSPAKRFQERGDHLVRHALRLCVEAEEDSPDGYLLRLSQGRKWVVTSV